MLNRCFKDRLPATVALDDEFVVGHFAASLASGGRRLPAAGALRDQGGRAAGRLPSGGGGTGAGGWSRLGCCLWEMCGWVASQPFFGGG